jgi:plasmid stabilization system protein ParE
MPDIRLSPRAEQDIEAILAWTHEEFGEKARLRYEALLTRAILDVAESPERGGSHERPEITAAARTNTSAIVATGSRSPLERCSVRDTSCCSESVSMGRSRSAGYSTTAWTSSAVSPKISGQEGPGRIERVRFGVYDSRQGPESEHL